VRRRTTMQEPWLHYGWEPFTERPVIFGVHGTEESARLDCPADILAAEGEWVIEGVAPLGRDPFLLEGLRDYIELMKGVRQD
jgi:hypothetical protein